MRAELGAEVQRVRNAGNAEQRQRLRGRRLVAGDLVRGRTVQPDIISKCDPPLRSALHDDQPAAGSDLDRNIVSEAVFFDRFQEDSLAGKDH